MNPAFRALGTAYIPRMNRSGALAKRTALPRMQRRLYFGNHGKRNLFRSFGADI